MARRAGVRVSQRLLNFTQRQDLELTAGLDVDWPVEGRGGVRLGGGGGGGGRRLGGSKPTAVSHKAVVWVGWGVGRGPLLLRPAPHWLCRCSIVVAHWCPALP